MILNGPSCGSPSVSKHTAPKHPEGEDEIEYLTDFSWRNFFCAITFVRIMQKMTKGRSHRISMLVNYKGSVRNSINESLARGSLPSSRQS